MEKRDTYLQSELRGLWSDKINNGKSQTELELANKLMP